MLCNDRQRDPSVMLSAMDATQTRIGPVLYATALMNHRVASHFTRAAKDFLVSYFICYNKAVQWHVMFRRELLE